MQEPTPRSPHEAVEMFRDVRDRFTTLKLHGEMQQATEMAVGFLLGAGLPYAAAAVSLMAEKAYPKVDDWGWIKSLP
jgi:hypothetical protein